MSKGFCITRELLDRSEVTIVAITMGASYLGFSAYMVQQIQLSFMLIVMMFIFFYLNVKYTINNIKILQARYSILRNTNLELLLSSYAVKLKLLKCYLAILHLFFVIQLSLLLAVEVGGVIIGDSSLRSSNYVNFTDELCESLVIIIILYIFRSKDRGQLYFASIFEDENEDEMPPPLLSARIPNSHDISVSRDSIILVFCPQDFNILKPHHRLIVATPYRQIISEAND